MTRSSPKPATSAQSPNITSPATASSSATTEVEVLAPDASYLPGPTPANNDSLVLRIQYGQTSALLEGDAEAPSEARMIAEGLHHSDLLKIGHHGSRTSTTPPFLAAVTPSYAVISVGSRNLYGHPRREVLEELQTGTRPRLPHRYSGHIYVLSRRQPSHGRFAAAPPDDRNQDGSPHGTIFLVSDCVFPLYDSLKAAPILAFPELMGRSRAAWWRRLDGPGKPQ